jgi:hypothetical protein
MRSFLFLTAALTLSPFVARAESTHTVSWFQSHPITRDRVHELCMNDPGEAAHTPDCLNAAEAVLRDATRRTEASIPKGETPEQICAQHPLWWRQAVCVKW